MRQRLLVVGRVEWRVRGRLLHLLAVHHHWHMRHHLRTPRHILPHKHHTSHQPMLHSRALQGAQSAWPCAYRLCSAGSLRGVGTLDTRYRRAARVRGSAHLHTCINPPVRVACAVHHGQTHRAIMADARGNHPCNCSKGDAAHNGRSKQWRLRRASRHPTALSQQGKHGGLASACCSAGKGATPPPSCAALVPWLTLQNTRRLLLVLSRSPRCGWRCGWGGAAAGGDGAGSAFVARARALC